MWLRPTYGKEVKVKIIKRNPLPVLSMWMINAETQVSACSETTENLASGGGPRPRAV